MNLPCMIFSDLNLKKAQFVFLLLVFLFSKTAVSQISEKSSLIGLRTSGVYMNFGFEYHFNKGKDE